MTRECTTVLSIQFKSVLVCFAIHGVLFHTIKIFDTISRQTQWFAFANVRLVSRLVLFLCPTIMTLVFLLLNHSYEDNESVCNIVYCKLHETLDFVAYTIYMIIIILIVVHIIKCSIKLKTMINEPNPNYSEDKMQTLHKIRNRMWVFPIGSFIYWVFRLLFQVISERESGWAKIFLVISSLRGLMYSAMFFITQECLRIEIVNTIICCRSPIEIDKVDLMMITTEETNSLRDEIIT